VRKRTDASQSLRLAVQLAFVALNVWIAIEFTLWVHWLEVGGKPAVRPPGVEAWLPIAGLMNLKVWIVTRVVPEVHPAAMFLILAILLMSLLLRKAFCSWVCPIGTLSEMLWKPLRSTLAIPRWLDVPLRGVKYALLAFFVWAIMKMPADAIAEFMRAPYGVVADVKMLNFFRFMSTTTVIVLAVLLGLSVAIRNLWCRYLCPYGALLGVVALFSPARIRRDADACIDCAKCTKACPSRLPVDRLTQVRSAECTLCMSCVAACPVKEALAVKVTKTRELRPRMIAAAIVILLGGIVIAARVSGHWATHVPDDLVRYFLSLH
jgi:polyferredoxin